MKKMKVKFTDNTIPKQYMDLEIKKLLKKLVFV